MPLPNFSDFRTVWVEKTKSSHGHGGKGWEFGSCLWSPTTDKAGKHIYENMVAARDGDLVLHFYEDAPFGNKLDHYFVGVSVVDGAPEIRDQPPELPGEWSARPKYYRVNLRGFTALDDEIPLKEFAREREGDIAKAIRTVKDQPFITYEKHVRLAQGKYLSRCGRELYEVLSNAVDEVVALRPDARRKSAPNEGQQKKQTVPQQGGVFDYEGYVEGQRARREALFFARNPRLIQDAKEYYGYRCQACQFQYDIQYPVLGAGYIEMHHLNPLSERSQTDGDSRLSRLDQVVVLCANCHRMIHRLIRKLNRVVSLEEFREQIIGAH